LDLLVEKKVSDKTMALRSFCWTLLASLGLLVGVVLTVPLLHRI